MDPVTTFPESRLKNHWQIRSKLHRIGMPPGIRSTLAYLWILILDVEEPHFQTHPNLISSWLYIPLCPIKNPHGIPIYRFDSPII